LQTLDKAFYSFYIVFAIFCFSEHKKQDFRLNGEPIYYYFTCKTPFSVFSSLPPFLPLPFTLLLSDFLSFLSPFLSFFPSLSLPFFSSLDFRPFLACLVYILEKADDP
jgi:hypothetical protein